MILPPEAHALVQVLALHFTSPTYQRFSTLMVAALVTTGRRTVANLLRTLRHLAPGHRTDYQRVLSRAPWSGLALGCALARFLLDHFVPDGPVTLVGDDTVDGHKGTCVCGLVAIRWVFVRDTTGTHRDEYFFTTDIGLSVSAVIAVYCGRWNIGTTVQEMRSELGLETTRGWREKTVRRAAPCLFGLYTVVAILFHTLPESKRTGTVKWPGKTVITFSDALAAVRRWLWAESLLPQAGQTTGLEKLPESVRELLLTTLAPAA